MLKRFVAGFVYGAFAIAALTSCGDSKAGGTGQFATVFATANAPNGPLDADVATWVDATTGAASQPCLATSIPTVPPTVATYNITSTPFTLPNTGQGSTIGTSDLVITRITLTLPPANSATPALPARFQTQFLS